MSMMKCADSELTDKWEAGEASNKLQTHRHKRKTNAQSGKHCQN